MFLITGGSGQLGTELRNLLDEMHIVYDAPDSKKFDITNYDLMKEYVNNIKITAIIHCAAYTAVDDAEDIGIQTNELINVTGSQNIADLAKELDIILVYLSTDYVFDGENGKQEYSETAQTNPVNQYGNAKLKAENIISEVVKKSYVIRTSWVFGRYGKNFVKTMKNIAKNNSTISIVDDQIGRPTWTRSLSEFIIHILAESSPYGIYNFSNEGTCSWYEFGKEILKDEKNLDILAVSSDKFPQKARRPKYSIFNLDKAKSTGFKIITWHEALKKLNEEI